MNGVRFVSDVDEESSEMLVDRLRSFNESSHRLVAALRDRPDDLKQIAAYAYNGDALAGGISATVWQTWHWLNIEVVWVDEALRGKGIGSMLLHEIESQAIALGCTWARLNTWEFQAPKFYEKFGYRAYGVLENFPEGVTEYLMSKRLV